MNDQHHMEKLVLNFKSDPSDSFFISPGDEFDTQFDTSFALHPQFKYYDTHDFHILKNKVTNSFSVLHTNICSLQKNGEDLFDLINAEENEDE